MRCGNAIILLFAISLDQGSRTIVTRSTGRQPCKSERLLSPHQRRSTPGQRPSDFQPISQDVSARKVAFDGRCVSRGSAIIHIGTFRPSRLVRPRPNSPVWFRLRSRIGSRRRCRAAGRASQRRRLPSIAVASPRLVARGDRRPIRRHAATGRGRSRREQVRFLGVRDLDRLEEPGFRARPIRWPRERDLAFEAVQLADGVTEALGRLQDLPRESLMSGSA